MLSLSRVLRVHEGSARCHPGENVNAGKPAQFAFELFATNNLLARSRIGSQGPSSGLEFVTVVFKLVMSAKDMMKL